MRRGIFIALVAAASLAPALASRSIVGPAEKAGLSGRRSPGALRVVSMAPSITEVLFGLGLGPEVAGVTRYCDYPAAAREKPRVGGYLDPNYEAILALQPDLVILLAEQASRRPFFEEIGIRTLVVDHSTVGGILNSILEVGSACAVEQAARDTVASLSARVDSVRRRVSGLARPRVLVTVGRNMSDESMGDMFISGRDGYYDQLIELAGGVNAYRERTVALPAVSAESLRELDPDVIIEMAPDLDKQALSRQAYKASWARFARGVSAVENGRVNVFGESYVVRPGPRFIFLLEELARTIHPGQERQ